MTMNDTWGFKSYDQNWKSTESLVRNLVDIASKGGNYLLNVGPTSEGLIPAPSVERLKEVGKWMKVNGEAIYGTSASPFKRLPWGRATKKVTAQDSTLYLHVFEWPADGKLIVPGLKNKPAKAFLLGDKSRKALAFEYRNEGLSIALPPGPPDPISSTVVLRINGQLEVEQATLQQNADGTIQLPASEARMHGEQIRYESGHERDNIGFWLDPEEWADWELTVKQPGTFQVSAEVAGPAASAISVHIGGQKITAKTPATGDYGKFQDLKLGTATLGASGKVKVELRGVKEGWNAVNVKAIHLKPVQQ
jgi:alpha-L-fucosidase